MTEVMTLRKCMMAEDGYTLLSLDASQIELRVLAFLSGDPQMIEDVRSDDLHMRTAIRIFGEDATKDDRYNAKQGNFALPFGGSDETVAATIHCSVEEAMEFRVAYEAAYPRLFQYIKEAKAQAVKDGYVVTMHGRIRAIPELKSASWKEREKAEKEGFNTIVQGSAVDKVKEMMLYLRPRYVQSIRLVLQVHDEMVWEVPLPMIDQSIRHAKELDIVFPDYPCSMKVGKYYGEMEDI